MYTCWKLPFGHHRRSNIEPYAKCSTVSHKIKRYEVGSIWPRSVSGGFWRASLPATRVLIHYSPVIRALYNPSLFHPIHPPPSRASVRLFTGCVLGAAVAGKAYRKNRARGVETTDSSLSKRAEQFSFQLLGFYEQQGVLCEMCGIGYGHWCWS